MTRAANPADAEPYYLIRGCACPDCEALKAIVLKAERARIRRELQGWLHADEGGWRDSFTPDSIAKFEAALDRICPLDDHEEALRKSIAFQDAGEE